MGIHFGLPTRTPVGFCSVQGQKIERLYNKQIEPFVGELETSDSILVRNPYSVDEKRCFSYRFRHVPEVKIAQLTDQKLIDKILKQSYEMNRVSIGVDYKFFHKYFDENSKLSIDFEKAISELKTQYASGEISEKSFQSGLVSAINLQNRNFLARHYKLEKAPKPKNGKKSNRKKRKQSDIKRGRKSKDGRIHTSISMCPQIIRPYVKYEGQTLAEVDLSSSGLYFLYLILLKSQDYLISNTKESSVIGKMVSRFNLRESLAVSKACPASTTTIDHHLPRFDLSPESTLNRLWNLNIGLNTIKKLGNWGLKLDVIPELSNESKSLIIILAKHALSVDRRELQRFGILVKNKLIYKSLVEDFKEAYTLEQRAKLYRNTFNEEYQDTNEHNRDLVKKRILMLMYASGQMTSGKGSLRKEKKIFSKQFPTIMRCITKAKTTPQWYKNEHSKSTKKVKKKTGVVKTVKYWAHYKSFAHLLFNVEADFILNLIARKFNKLNQKNKQRNIPVFPLHDCLVTTIDQVKNLKKFMEDTFKETVGEVPHMEWKDWTDKNVKAESRTEEENELQSEIIANSPE